MDFALSPVVKEKRERVQRFIREFIAPVEESYYKELHSLDNPYSNLPQLDELKKKGPRGRFVEFVF